MEDLKNISFIQDANGFSTMEKPVRAPLFRRDFQVEKDLIEATLVICGLGFYRGFLDGNDFTKGPLSPYMSNPARRVYFDRYDLTDDLKTSGKHTLGAVVGNGYRNAYGGFVWNFERAADRAAPALGFALTLRYADKTEVIRSDEATLTYPSAVTANDVRIGERYDARLYRPDWALPDGNTGGFVPAEPAPAPLGERLLFATDALRIHTVRMPESVQKTGNGYLYDFGYNDTGVCRLCIRAGRGQRITMDYVEMLDENGLPEKRNLNFAFQNHAYGYGENEQDIQRVVYTAIGEGEETYTPSFTYCGFRYVFVTGITEEQAKESLLTAFLFASDLPVRGYFTSSDEMLRRIFENAMRSDVSNFLYFPHDCPHREKNGWQGDACLSAEHFLLFHEAERSLANWLGDIRSSQRENGLFPPIVPDAEWGMEHYGPTHEAAVILIAFDLFMLRGDEQAARDNALAGYRYLKFVQSKRNERGLVDYGIGEWCHIGKGCHGSPLPKEPVISVYVTELCRKCAVLLAVAGREAERQEILAFGADLLAAVRNAYLTEDGTLFAVPSQTMQAMALAYGVIPKEKEERAFAKLLEIIHADGDAMNVGVHGMRCLFRLLSEHGYTDLALGMITRTDKLSYAYPILHGATTMYETINDDTVPPSSRNHHFWGDVTAWMLECITGIRPFFGRVNLCPNFPRTLTYAEGKTQTPAGDVFARWERNGGEIVFTVAADGTAGTFRLPKGYRFADGQKEKPLASGTYTVIEE